MARYGKLIAVVATLSLVATGCASTDGGTGDGAQTGNAGFGWTVDNLLEVELVAAEGRVLRASADENADLFSAARGGGGNFGIVTAFTFRLHAVGPTPRARGSDPA